MRPQNGQRMESRPISIVKVCSFNLSRTCSGCIAPIASRPGKGDPSTRRMRTEYFGGCESGGRKGKECWVKEKRGGVEADGGRLRARGAGLFISFDQKMWEERV